MILTIDEVRAVLARKGDLHKATAAKAFGIPEDQVTPEQRRWAKQANYRGMYASESIPDPYRLACPKCGAAAYRPCLTSSGAPSDYPHGARQRLR